MLSASKEVEAGFRAAILQADGLFRFDAAVEADTLRTVVRNLSPGELTMAPRSGYPGPTLALGSSATLEPSRHDLSFTLGTGQDRIEVNVLVATMRFADRGTYRITAQAVLRQSPESRAGG